ncbi:hypothetical protein [Blochmannia endosymbiont of Camponotus modoc]
MCKNDTRFNKNLWTCKSKGDAISLYCVFNVIGEAMFVTNHLID